MHMCYKLFTPLGYGVLLAKNNFRTKMAVAGLGLILKCRDQYRRGLG